MFATVDGPAAAESWKRFAPRLRRPVYPTRHGSEERVRGSIAVDSVERDSSAIAEEAEVGC
jgi:hypothetical protein